MEQQKDTTPEQKPGSHYRKWSPRDFAQLRRLHELGWTWEQIAQKLDRTPEAVRAMFTRLDLSKRAQEYGRQTSILEQADEVSASTAAIEPHQEHVEGAHGAHDLGEDETPPESPKTAQEAIHTVHVREVKRKPSPYHMHYQVRERRQIFGSLLDATRYTFTPGGALLDPDPAFRPWEVVERRRLLFGFIQVIKERREYLPPGHPDHPTYCRTFKAVTP